MTDLLKDLEAVVGLQAAYDGGDIDQAELIASSNFVHDHHAEIAEALADARRYRWLRTLQGEVLTKKWNGESWCDASYTELDNAIDAAIDAQHNSAREGL